MREGSTGWQRSSLTEHGGDRIALPALLAERLGNLHQAEGRLATPTTQRDPLVSRWLVRRQRKAARSGLTDDGAGVVSPLPLAGNSDGRTASYFFAFFASRFSFNDF
jgi:hypothetical protein